MINASVYTIIHLMANSETSKLRLFFALNIPRNLKRELTSWQEKYRDIPMRWTKPNNLHLTILFIGWIKKERLQDIIEGAKAVATSFPSFPIRFTGTDYGPPDGPKRMAWLYGMPSLDLAKLKRALELEMTRRNIPFTQELRESIPHITLGKIQEDAWRKKIREETPHITQALDVTISLGSLDLMKSIPQKSGSVYEFLGTFPFTGETSIA